MKDNIKKFIEYIKQEEFYEAHEILEEVWFPRRFEDSNEVKFIKGLINASVAFELYKKGRVKNAKKVWLNYLKYRQLLFKFKSSFYNELLNASRFVDSYKIRLNF